MSFFRQIAAPAISAVFITVSFLGTGLHLLPGCGHFHGRIAHGHAAHSHGRHCHAHHHNHAGHCPADPATCAITPSHEDCAICRFLAIPRVLTPPPTVVDRGIHFEPLYLVAVIQPSLDIERPYGARAPPRPSLST